MDVPSLVAVDERILVELLAVAIAEATADEVTPPLSNGLGWTEERREWFLAYHRARRAQLDGPTGESTWAVVHGDRPVGSVRLQRTADRGILEAGIWLARSVRGRGVGTSALRAVTREAQAADADTVVAETAAENLAAQTAMLRSGFTLDAAVDGRVRGSIVLRDARRSVRGVADRRQTSTD